MDGFQVIDPIGDLVKKPKVYREYTHHDTCKNYDCDIRLSIYNKSNFCYYHRKAMLMDADDVRTVRLVITTKDGKYQGNPILLEDDDTVIEVINDADTVLWSARL